MIHNSNRYSCLVGFNPSLHFGCLWWLFIDHDNDAPGQFITLCEFFDVPLEAEIIKTVVAQNIFTFVLVNTKGSIFYFFFNALYLKCPAEKAYCKNIYLTPL